MVWTRKTLTETSDWFNTIPLAPIDETLRIPIALEEIFKLLKEDRFTGFNLKNNFV